MAQPPDGAHVTYQRQRRKCGNPNCDCRYHLGHGPYWYAYWREDGRLRSRYLGKQTPTSVAAATVGESGER